MLVVCADVIKAFFSCETLEPELQAVLLQKPLVLPQSVVTLECAKRFKPVVRMVDGGVHVLSGESSTVPVQAAGTGKDRVTFAEHLARALSLVEPARVVPRPVVDKSCIEVVALNGDAVFVRLTDADTTVCDVMCTLQATLGPDAMKQALYFNGMQIKVCACGLFFAARRDCPFRSSDCCRNVFWGFKYCCYSRAYWFASMRLRVLLN
jgi:hypothetical protein